MAEKQVLPSFRFLGVDVERRLDRAGKPVSLEEGQDGYVPIDIAATYRPLLVATGNQTEKEDPTLEPLLMNGLVMPRLLAVRRDTYPKIESELPTIRATLPKLPKQEKEPFPAPAPEKEPVLPDHCLIRVLDASVKPGESYQYRIRVRMANPNHGRRDVSNPRDAQDTQLKPADGGKWFEMPGLAVPPGKE
jgi:hypothetical protein